MYLRVLRFLLLFVLAFQCGPVFAQQEANKVAESPSDELNAQLPKWLRFSGEFRARAEGFTGGGFQLNTDDAYLLTRIRLNMKVEPASWLRFVIQGQDAHVFGKNQNPAAPPYQDRMDLRVGYVEVGDAEKKNFGLRAGRQELAFGDERLIGNANWLNTARSFDGVRGTWKVAGVRVDAFATSVVKLHDGQFNEYIPGNIFYGLYASIGKLVPKATVEPYFLWRRQSGLATETATPGILSAGTFGIRWVGKLPAGFDYGLEMGRQSGSLGTDTVGAWAGHWLAGYTIPHARFTPHVVAEFNYASGDASGTDGQRGTFDQLYATAHDKYGLADQAGWKNIEHLRSGVEFKLNKKWSAQTKYTAWWLANTHDALYNAAGAVVAKRAAGNAGKFVGQEIDIQMSYNFNKMLGIAGGFGHIFPGTFLKNTTPGVAYNFPYATLTYSF